MSQGTATAPTTADPKTPTITLHWLEASRAQRILWLLEELGADYKLKLYHRHRGLADPALKEVHPLGKSPLIEVDYHDGKAPKVLAESGHIINFLIKHFDDNGAFGDLTDEDRFDSEYYLHLSEGSLQPLVLVLILHHTAYTRSPFFVKPAVSFFTSLIDNAFTIPEVKGYLGFLENVLKQNAEGLESDAPIYFVNNKFSGADIILVFNINVVFESSVFKHIYFDSSPYPFLKRYLDQIKTRAALLRAKNKIKEAGNGEYGVTTL